MKKMLLMLFLGFGVAFGADDIQTLTQKCEVGDARSCLYLGMVYDTSKVENPILAKTFSDAVDIGAGVTKSYSKALDLYIKACDLYDGLACYIAGDLYMQDKDYKWASHYSYKACFEFLPMGCELSGIADEKLGKVSDAEKAYSKGCALKTSEKQAEKIRSGKYFPDYVDEDWERAKKACANSFFSEEVCVNSIIYSCNQVGILNISKKPLSKHSRDMGINYFKKACELGSKEGCDNYKKATGGKNGK